LQSTTSTTYVCHGGDFVFDVFDVYDVYDRSSGTSFLPLGKGNSPGILP
jgi:hypothetical protein